MVVSISIHPVLAPVVRATALAGVLAGALSATSYAGDPIPPGLVEAVRASFAERACDGVTAWEARSRGGLMLTRFVDGRIEVFDRGARTAVEVPFGLQLESTGRAGDQHPVEDADVAIDRITASRGSVEESFVEYRRGDFVEWYVNDTRGLAQGFTFDVRPTGDGPLELRLGVLGGYEGRLVGERSMRLTSPDGPAVEYSGLAAWDATGRELSAHLVFANSSTAQAGGQIVIQVDDQGATYPVTIDPVVTFEDVQLVGSDSVADDLFGASISISGDIALVGAPEHEAVGEHSGATYVFRRTGTSWAEETELVASDAGAFDLFGHSVAVFDNPDPAMPDRAVVGAPGDVDNISSPGKVYVFVFTAGSWSEQEILTASDAAADDMFGYAVAITPLSRPDSILVGAPGNDDAGSRSGSAYVFRLLGAVWPEEQKLFATDAGPLDMYGSSVSIYGDRCVIGSPGDDNACVDPLPQNCDSGSAYAYRRVGVFWSSEVKLLAGEPANEDQFGTSVAIFDDKILVGAPFDDDKGADAGTVYAFVRSGGRWPEEGQVLPTNLKTGDNFGRSVALFGNIGLGGAPNTDNACPVGFCDSGSAFLFLRQGGYSIGPSASSFVGLAFDQNSDTLYASNATDLYTIDTFTGTDTLVGNFVNAADIQGLAYDPNTDTLYGMDAATQTLFTINTTTGEATSVGPGTSFIFGLAFDPNTDTLYGTGAPQRLFVINTGNGVMNSVGAPGSLGSTNIFDLAFDAITDTLLGYDNALREFVAIDVATGETAAAGTWGAFGETEGLTFDPNANRLFGTQKAPSRLLAVSLPIWTTQAELVPDFTAAGDHFGSAVALGDGLAGVGAETRQATGTAHIFRIGGGADLCEDAHVISGDGTFLFDNVGRSTDGLAHPSCVFPNGMDQVFNDIWFRWTAECTTDVHVATCGGTSLDTEIAVYEGTTCPATTARLLVCDNDLSPCGPLGRQTEVVFPVIEGEEYLIRIGSAVMNQEGSGLFTISFVCSLCPSTTLASSWEAPNPLVAAQMLARLHRLRDALRGSPNGQRLVNLYYTHAAEMSRILREKPRLRRLALALIDLLTPGIESLIADGDDPGEVVVSGHALMLLDAILRGFEEENADGDLARAIRAERHRFDIGTLAGKSFAEAWQDVASQGQVRVAPDAKGTGR